MNHKFKDHNWATSKKELKAKKNQPRSIKNIKQLSQTFTSGCKFNYMSIEAPPSLKPSKRYCDITGYETKYKDPLTSIFYFDSVVFNYVRTISKPTADVYLAIRNQIPSLQ